MSSAALRSVALRRSAPVRISRRQAKAARLASEMFSVTEDSSTSPDRLRSSGTRKMPWSMASRGARMAIVRPSRRSFAADRAVDAEDGAGKLGAAGADQARQAEDLAARAAARSIACAGCAGCAQAGDLEYRTAGRASAAGHRATSGRGRSSGGSWRRARSRPSPAPRRRAVAQHHDAVGAVLDLVQAMRDEDDGDAGGLEFGDHLQETRRLGGGQARGRLVHDDDARLERQRLGDLDAAGAGRATGRRPACRP